MDSTVYANAVEIRRNEFGQKWIILLKEFFQDKDVSVITACFD